MESLICRYKQADLKIEGLKLWLLEIEIKTLNVGKFQAEIMERIKKLMA